MNKGDMGNEVMIYMMLAKLQKDYDTYLNH